MILSFHPCFVADRQIILGARSLSEEDRACIREARAIILPQTCSPTLFRACAAASALRFPHYDLRFRYPGKIGQGRLFGTFGFATPRTLAWSSVAAFRKAEGEAGVIPHRTPFLLKADRSHEAAGVWMVKDPLSRQQALEALSLLEESGTSGFVSQDLVSSGGNVLRAVILGKRIRTYWKRPDHPQRILTTASLGALIDRRWRADLQEKGRRQAQRFLAATGINVAALDFVFPLDRRDPEPLLLEINYYFGRRGLGGSEIYYRMLYQALREWMTEEGLDPQRVSLV